MLEGYDSVPEDAEVYIVLEGSTLVHVTRAQSDVMLCFIVPGMVIYIRVLLCYWMHFGIILHTHSL